MAGNRGMESPRLLCSGPARLAQAFGIARPDNDTDLVRDDSLFLLAGEALEPRSIGRSTRVGVHVGVERRWRWFERGSAFVSRGRPSVTAPTGSRRS
jgi:DNA-3-methyladenine glycosylase